jgi:hypothetical protein
MNCLSEGEVLVSYGGTSRKPMVVQGGRPEVLVIN